MRAIRSAAIRLTAAGAAPALEMMLALIADQHWRARWLRKLRAVFISDTPCPAATAKPGTAEPHATAA